MTARTTFGCWPTRTMVGCWFVGRTRTTRGVGTTQTIRSTRSSPERDFVHTTPGTTQLQFTQVKQTTRLIIKSVCNGNCRPSLYRVGPTGGQGQKSERGVQFPFQRGGCQFFLSGEDYPPSTQFFFRLRHLLIFKVVRPPVINLWCGSYSLALHLQIRI